MTLCPRAAEMAAAPLPPAGTYFEVFPTEGLVLELCARGLEDHEIAEALGIGYRSVRSVYDRLTRRTGERGRTRLAVLWAISRQRTDLLPLWERAARMA